MANPGADNRFNCPDIREVDIRIAITGASGFVGQYVLEAVAALGHDIVVASRSMDWLRSLDNTVQAVQLDIENPGADPFNTLGHPDLLLHLAWSGLPNYRSAHHVESELPSQKTFLELMVNAGLENLTVTGTCFEYGMKSGALAESIEPEPDNPYGVAKDALRRSMEDLKISRPFNLTWARLFYMYGAGQGENSLYSLLKQAVSRREKVFNMSGGEQIRDYLHVSEVADLLVSLATSRKDNGVVNICSGKPISIRSLVEGWIKDEAMEITMNLGYYPYPDYEPMSFWGDRTRLDKLLEDEVTSIKDGSK